MKQKERVVVLGAGVGGLAVGYFLARTGRYDVTVLENAPVIGGLCASFQHNGFVLDYGAHKLYSVIPGILDEIRDLMGDRLLTLPKKNRLYLRGHLVDYPLRLGNLARALGLRTFVQLGVGYAISLLAGLRHRLPASSYEEYVIRRFGRPTYELVFAPLAEKVWGDPSSLHPEMARARIPASGGMEVVLKLLGLRKETADTNAESFYYPRAGFGDWPQAMAEKIEALGGRILVEADTRRLVREADRITGVEARLDGKVVSIPADYLVSTIPLPLLESLVFGDTNPPLKHAMEGLQFRHLILVYVFAKRPLVLEDQWIFFPEKKFIFSRIFEQKQMNPELGPADATVITADFTTNGDDERWLASDEELTAQVVQGLVQAGFINKTEVTGSLVVRRRNFYPRYDLAYTSRMQSISAGLQQVSNLLLSGRIGMYNYNNSDHCADMGRFIAQGLAAGQSPRFIWQALELRVKDYKIVD